MYYSNSNYEAFVRPRTPKGVETRSAYLVGGGLASLAAAAFLVRDGGMPGERITILEASKVPGGALDGASDGQTGWLIRGGREMEEQFQCLWDLYRSIPSLTIDGASVLDEYHRLDKDDPSFAPVRVTYQQGVALPDRHLLTLDRRARTDLILLVLAKEEDLDGKTIQDVFGYSFFQSNFWLFWRSMFAFEEWHSAIEMRRYLMRFIHHIVGLADLHTLKFARYNQYESMVRPLVTWLKDQGVVFQYDTRVTNIELDIADTRKVARKITWLRDREAGGVDLAERDLVIVTNGSMVENSAWGDHHTPAPVNTAIEEGSIWALWRNLAHQDPSFGRPDVFCTTPEQTNWESATVTTLDNRIPLAMEKVIGRSVRSGRIGTGGPVTVKDSAWLMSWVVSRQPHFPDQPGDQVVAWIYGLFSDRPGNYVHKPMRDCTGEEITKEWLFHLGVPVDEINDLAATRTAMEAVYWTSNEAFRSPTRRSTTCGPCLPRPRSSAMVRRSRSRHWFVPGSTARSSGSCFSRPDSPEADEPRSGRAHWKRTRSGVDDSGPRPVTAVSTAVPGTLHRAALHLLPYWPRAHVLAPGQRLAYLRAW